MFSIGHVATSASAIGFLLAFPVAAQATDLVQNGGFTPAAGTATMTGWSFSGAINNLYAVDPADAVNGVAPADSFWNAGNGGTGAFTAPPSGSAYFEGSDGNVYPNWLTTSLSGLTVGATYSLSFDWAAGEAVPYSQSSSFTTGWQYYIGQFSAAFTNGCGPATCPDGPVLGSVSATIPSQDFSGWFTKTTTFVATASTETLGFLAFADEGAAPPFVLLTGVSVPSAPVAGPAPEPATWVEMLLGFFMVGGVLGHVRRRKTPLSA